MIPKIIIEKTKNGFRVWAEGSTVWLIAAQVIEAKECNSPEEVCEEVKRLLNELN